MSDEAPKLDDLLERASAALREETSAPNPRSGLTRARMLDSAEKRYAARRRPWLRWLVPVTGVFVVGTALAQRAPDYWPALREVLRPVLGLSEPKPARQPRSGPRVLRPTPAPEPTPPVVEAAPAAPSVLPEVAPAAPSVPPEVAPEPPPAAPRDSAPRGQRSRRAKPRPPAIQPVVSPPVEPVAKEPAPTVRSAELELFRRAQTLHTAHDAAALAAWDAYLRIATQGVLVPEARYNRALCLIRLGRRAEAKLALMPFARGEYGAYRRTEAQTLLAELQ